MFRLPSISRRSMAVTSLAAAFAVSSLPTPVSVCDAVVPFDSKGFTATYLPSAQFFKNPKPMILAGAGMRRKSFYVVEVDVYKTGFNVTPEALARTKAAVAANTSISDAIKANKTGGDFPECAIVLKFVRTVSAQQVVDAFDAAFVGCDPNSIALFKSKLKHVIGDNGMKNDEEITFFWKTNGGLLITRNGSDVGGAMDDGEIEKRLLDVYVDPARTVSKELVDCIFKNVGSL